LMLGLFRLTIKRSDMTKKQKDELAKAIARVVRLADKL
jgi:hypothetical protein